MTDCFLNIYKPIGITAHNCIAKLRRILHQKRIGHAGTLDPMAVGVLPVAVGQYTRLLSYLAGNKSYRAKFTFGLVTDTDDITGQVRERCACSDLSFQRVQSLLPEFVGNIWQKPPAYSAVHFHGKRLYEMARTHSIDLEQIPARLVKIYAIRPVNWWSGDFPEIEVDIDCGGGTYIRAIARDLGAMLGCGGTLSALERTASNGFLIQESRSLEEIQQLAQQQQHFWVSPHEVFAHLPSVILSQSELQKWQKGQSLTLPHDCHWSTEQAIATYDFASQLVGISLVFEQLLCPKVVLPPQLQ